MLGILYEINEVSFHLIGTNHFYIQEENESFSAVDSHCCQISSRRLADDVKNKCKKVRATRAARRFFPLIRPII